MEGGVEILYLTILYQVVMNIKSGIIARRQVAHRRQDGGNPERPVRMRSISLFLLMLLLAVSSPLGWVGAQEVQTEIEGQIAYAGPEGNIWVLRGDLSEPIQVTFDAEQGQRYLTPRWSPDGSLLAYCQENTAAPALSKLYFVRTGEWQPFALAEDVYCPGFPLGGLDWTPDGRKITYARNFDYNPQPGGYPWSSYYGIWTVDVISGERQEFLPATGPNPLILPEWSPDQESIRFYEIVYIEGSGVLQTWNSQTDSLTNWLGRSDEVYPGYSSWSPDGSQLVFDVVSYAGFPGAGLYLSSPDASTVNRLFVDPNQAAVRPLWSTAGDTIAFHLLHFGRNVQQPSSLVLIGADGSNPQVIRQSETSLVPVVWSPSGGELLYAMDIGGQVELFIYDLETATSTSLGVAGDWSVDWSALPPPREPSLEAQEVVEIPNFPASLSVMIYVGEGYQLKLLDPANGEETPLTDSMRVASFWPSPTGKRLVYGDTLMALDFLSDSSLQVRRVELPAIPEGGEISWSPDENQLAMRDESGSVWVIDANGKALPVPDAASLPVWSADGGWLAYCNEKHGLMVIGPGVPANEIAEQVVCSPQWSSTGNLLAYTTQSEGEPGEERVHLYDAQADSTHLVMQSASLESWSADGQLLAVRQAEAATGDSQAYTVFVIDPREKRKIAVGTFRESDIGLKTWASLTGEYVFGQYRIAPDLSGVTRLADALLAITPSGSRTLTGIGQRDLVTVACAHLAGGGQQMLGTIYLTGVPAEDKPGVWGWLSPDGAWSALYNYDSAGYIHQLHHCDQEQQVKLPAGTQPLEQAFSPDSRWHMVSTTDDQGRGEIVLHDLVMDRQKSLPAVPNAHAVWLQSLVLPPPETYTVTGQVSVPNGAQVPGVEILVNGVVSATTDEEGAYAIGGLLAGDYTLMPRLEEYTFSPSEAGVKLPLGPLQVDFYAALVDTGEVIEEEEQSPEEVVPPPVTSPQLPYAWLDLIYAAPQTVGLGILLLCAPLLFLLVIIFALRRRSRRKRKAAESIPLPEETEPEVRALPMPADTQAEVWMREGVAYVKQGKNKEALRTLRKVVRVTPENPTAWLWLGLAAARTGDHRAAERCFKHAEKLGHPKAKQALEWLGSEGE